MDKQALIDSFAYCGLVCAMCHGYHADPTVARPVLYAPLPCPQSMRGPFDSLPAT